MSRESSLPSSKQSIYSNWQRSISIVRFIFLGIILLIPVLVYSITIVKNAYNFPFEDDFNSALSFVTEFEFYKTSLSERVTLLFDQYNEHRILFDRLVFLSDYHLFGSLNFRRLALVGNISVLLLAILFLKLSFRSFSWHQRLLYLIPVAYSLFLFHYWELTTWSMAALSNFYVVVFSLFSLYELNRPGKIAFLLSCGTVTLATFTVGNGLFCFLAGVPVLFFMKNYRRLGVWIVLGAINISIYFWHYTRPPYHPDITDTLLNHTGQAVRYFFTLVGAFFPSRPGVSLLFGLVMALTGLGLLFYRWRAGRMTDNLPMLGFLFFLYLTCLSVTAGRSGFGVQQAYSTRYGFVTVALYATQAVLIIEAIRSYYWRTGVALCYGLLAILLFMSGTNTQHRRAIEHRSAELHDLTNRYKADPAHTKLPWGNPKQAKAIFDDALYRGVYQLNNESN